MSTFEDVPLGEPKVFGVADVAIDVEQPSSSSDEESAAAPSVTKEISPKRNKSGEGLHGSRNDRSFHKEKWIGIALITIVIAVAVIVVIAVPVALIQRSSNPTPTTGGDTTLGTTDDSPNDPFISQANQADNRFAERLPNLDQRNVMAGYGSCSDLLKDVQHALERMANAQIESGRDTECWWDPHGPYKSPSDNDSNVDDYYPCPLYYNKEADARADAAPSTSDSYGTNNQVDGADEADIVKSNGEFVFMGYGHEVIVIDLTGNVLDRVDVPLPPNATQLQPGFREGNFSSNSDGWGCGGPPQPQYRQVSSLLLMDEDTDRGAITLNVITTFDDWKCNAALCGGLTTAFVYKFNTQELKLNLLASQDINGSYNNARGIGSINHIVTEAYIDTWEFIYSLDRCNDQHYWNTTYEEYEKLAFQKANRTVAEYAQKIVDGLSWVDPSSDAGSSCKHIVQLSTMTVGDEELSMEEKRKLNEFVTADVLQTFFQITSLNVTNVTSPAADAVRNDTLGTGLGTIDSRAAGAFLSYYMPELYSTESDLILAGRGWRYDGSGEWDEHTFLMSFDLESNGTSFSGAVPSAIGQVPGYLKNQFSLDLFEGHLRVATTNSERWSRIEITDEETGEVIETHWMVTANSTSQVTILEEDGNGLLKQVGMVGDLGEGEDIKSVRFIGDRGYVVTFRTVDPLYSLDLSLPTNPKKVGELKITGFSEYLHPISNSADLKSRVGDYLLTIGKEADEADDGRVIGTKISVFDVRDIENATLVGDFVLDNPDNGWSGSDAAFDHHAFRYVSGDSKLIIPLHVYSWENPGHNFDGFVVYDIDILNEAITVAGNVTHTEGQQTMDWCWSRASLPSRSMVFKGDLMTFKSHSIKFTKDINNLGGDVWSFGELNLDENRTKDEDHDCYGYWPWM